VRALPFDGGRPLRAGHRAPTRRLAQRALNVGAIVNLSPDLSVVANLLGVDQATVRTVLQSWGPGKFDAEVFLDGKAFRSDGKSAATLLPAAFGLAGVNMHTYLPTRSGSTAAAGEQLRPRRGHARQGALRKKGEVR
jgi:hypothetical protein